MSTNPSRIFDLRSWLAGTRFSSRSGTLEGSEKKNSSKFIGPVKSGGKFLGLGFLASGYQIMTLTINLIPYANSR